jgi:hypothetical protein
VRPTQAILKDAALFLRVAAIYVPDTNLNTRNKATGGMMKIRGLRTVMRELADEIDIAWQTRSEGE